MLFVVSTPIGNLGDITYRAVEALKSSDMIACEDTRRTKILLNHYGIRKPLVSYHAYNKMARADYLLGCLKTGKHVALVSDAGTPGISDPGFALIKKVLEEDIEVVSIPGPTAFVCALSVSGLPTHKFFFEGFLSPKCGTRKKRLQWLKALNETVVFYESPHRILKTLDDMLQLFGNIEVVIAREMTKKFEEVLKGKLEQHIARFKASRPKGEFVVVF